MKKINELVKKFKLNIICIILILALSIFLRVYKLDQIPDGVNVDEAGMAYDAFCLANFRVDRALNKLPVYFVNFGGGQSILYGYVTAIFIKMFGFKLFWMRLTAVIFNCIAILLCYFMIKKHIGEKSALLVTALLAINPWNIMASRWGLDCNLLAPCLIISLFFLLRAQKWYDYLLAGISIGVTLYTYALSYAIIPIFLCLVLVYMLYTKKIMFKNIVVLGIPIFIFAIPLMLMILVNNGIINQINWIITIPKLPNYRGSEISLGNVILNLKSLDTIFIYDDLPFNSLSKYGTLYNFAIVLAVIGFVIELYNFVINIKNKKYTANSVILLLFIASFSFMMCIDDLHISKANAIYFPLIFFEYSAIYFIYKMQKIKLTKELHIKEKIKILVCRLLLVVITILYIVNFVSFSNYYFTKYATDYAQQQFFENDLLRVLEQVNGRAEFKEKDVYIYTGAEQPYIYTLYANPISPYDFNETRDEYNNYGRYTVLTERTVDESGVYIVRADSDFSYELATYHGFVHEEIGTYILLYQM